MTRDEKLDAILAHCRELLALSEKRTTGKWKVVQTNDGKEISNHRQSWVASSDDIVALNATFIASCAGNAEAGWRSTIEAIEGLRQMENFKDLNGSSRGPWCENDGQGCMACNHASEMLDSIITAWEGQL